jgi:hypothetical protein
VACDDHMDDHMDDHTDDHMDVIGNSATSYKFNPLDTNSIHPPLNFINLRVRKITWKIVDYVLFSVSEISECAQKVF